MQEKPIHVTEPFLPPLDDYVEYLRGIWDRNWLTNQGPLVKELEEKLKLHHALKNSVCTVANGGLGLQLILKAIGVKGEVITTPFSYVATASCPIWEGCRVRFADIETDCLTIQPEAVEAAITSDTEAIVGTHVFGNPCDCEALESIAARHGIALIFDAAHAFGVEYKGKSILDYGDASMVSLHATKLMHSVEGGFVTTKSHEVLSKIEWMRRFGHDGCEAFHGVGINAKMSEFHAAMGLCNLKYVDQIIDQRRRITEIYDKAFSDPEFSNGMGGVVNLVYRTSASRNYAYYPVIFSKEDCLLAVMEELKEKNIFGRRYFYPDLASSLLEKGNICPSSADISRRILCLPLSHSLSEDVVAAVVEIVKSACGES